MIALLACTWAVVVGKRIGGPDVVGGPPGPGPGPVVVDGTQSPFMSNAKPNGSFG